MEIRVLRYFLTVVREEGISRAAEEILALVDKTEQELAEQEENIEGTVSIGCGDLAALARSPAKFSLHSDTKSKYILTQCQNGDSI